MKLDILKTIGYIYKHKYNILKNLKPVTENDKLLSQKNPLQTVTDMFTPHYTKYCMNLPT